MTTITLSGKGQFTLPSDIRKKANLRPGTKIDVELRNDEIILRRVKSLRELAGALKPYAVGKTTDLDEIREQVMRVEVIRRDDDL